jgi:hypothetical protein
MRRRFLSLDVETLCTAQLRTGHQNPSSPPPLFERRNEIPLRSIPTVGAGSLG